jgi:hypothetical protein
MDRNHAWRGDIDQKAKEIESEANRVLSDPKRANDPLWRAGFDGELGVRTKTLAVARSWMVIDPSMSKPDS